MKEKRKTLLFSLLILMLAVLGAIGIYYWYENTYYVSTEDTQVTGDLVTVTTQISGKIAELNFDEGDTVVKDQILGRQEMINSSDKDVDQSLLRAPVNGIILKKEGTTGEAVNSGETLAIMIDTDKLYVSANVEETKLNKIKPGQQVDITIDQYSGEKFAGTVKFIGKATNSTFSLLPSSTSGTFTKVVQKIPVKIEISKGNREILAGTNAIVKIHIR